MTGNNTLEEGVRSSTAASRAHPLDLRIPLPDWCYLHSFSRSDVRCLTSDGQTMMFGCASVRLLRRIHGRIQGGNRDAAEVDQEVVFVLILVIVIVQGFDGA